MNVFRSILFLVFATSAFAHEEISHESMEGMSHGGVEINDQSRSDVSRRLKGNSIYQLGGVWQNQNAESVEIADLVGKKQVMAMIYTSCQHVCPVIVSSMKCVEQKISKSKIDDVGFVLISFTPEVDTHEVLMGYSTKHKLNLDRWQLLRTDPGKVREIAMMLGIKYQLLENNEVNHSNIISVLGDSGELLFQESGNLSHAKIIAQKINELPD